MDRDRPPSAVGETPARRVLLVEDDPLIRMATADTLVDIGHDVLEAGSAEDALRLLDREAVDLLITDVTLPGMGGGDLAVEARRRLPALGVIFATGANAAPQDSEGRDIEGAILLLKPFNSASLAKALREAQTRRA